MSEKIPFLQMFAALRRWTELANAAEGWVIVSAAIDKASRSAQILVEGAQGAGTNLIREAEETVCRAYGLNSVKITCSQPQPPAAAVERVEEPIAPPRPAGDGRFCSHGSNPCRRAEKYSPRRPFLGGKEGGQRPR